MRAIVHLLPGPADLSQAFGQQIAQALSALGGSGMGRIPIEVPPQALEREVVIEGADRTINDAFVLRILDAQGRELFACPLSRLDTVRFER